jgi:hypothetical protein
MSIETLFNQEAYSHHNYQTLMFLEPFLSTILESQATNNSHTQKCTLKGYQQCPKANSPRQCTDILCRFTNTDVKSVLHSVNTSRVEPLGP